MSLVPALRVVPIGSVRRHEEIDPKRVSQILTRISDERVQINPVICMEADGRFVILDGASRSEAIRSLGLTHIVVQVVDPATVTLENWHHVLRNCPPEEVVGRIAEVPGLHLSDSDGAPRLTTREGSSMSVLGADMSPYATMSGVAHAYIGLLETSRIIDPGQTTVSRRFPDWSVIVEFPTVEISDVVKAALSRDLLPAGVTRFLIPERVLRLHAPLSILETGDQAMLDQLVDERSISGRVRRYEETVVILDD